MLRKENQFFFLHILTKKATTKVVFKALKKKQKKASPPSCNQRGGRVESHFHPFIILYWKLSLIWPGGGGGGRGEEAVQGEDRRKDRGAFPSRLPPARRASSSGPHRLQPSRRRHLRWQHPPRGGRTRQARPLGLSRESLGRGEQRPRRHRFPPLPPHPPWVRGHYSRRRSPRGKGSGRRAGGGA